ncbi:MAG: heparan-alpha-glucosaminide N-acetyltransferase [Nitratireductor sp.]
MTVSAAAPASRLRLAVIDLARGIALAAMTVFHFCWDLEMFGLVDRGFMAQPAAIWSARIIAGSFLFLVGFSLVLAHGERLKIKAFLKRLALIAGAAALISIATWYFTPDAFIFFGILHSIAVSSVIALVFLRAPWWLTALAGLFIVSMRSTLQTPMLDDPWWWWSGLSQFIPRSNDYVPLFPYLGMVLIGVAAGKLARSTGIIAMLAEARLAWFPANSLCFIGRKSLAYYLLHQPVMIALLYAALKLSGRI